MKTGKPNVLVWWKKGDAWIWVNGAAVAVSIIAVMGLLLLLAVKGLGHFWPDDILETRYRAPGADAAEEIVLIGEIVDREMVSGAQLVSAGIGVTEESRQYPASCSNWVTVTLPEPILAGFWKRDLLRLPILTILWCSSVASGAIFMVA